MVKQEDINKAIQNIHFDIHVLRKTKFKDFTQFELSTAYIISGLFENECEECKNSMETKRRQAELQMKGQGIQQNKSFIDKVLGK